MSDQQERKVPVLRSENSLIEQEFDSIREKFQLEMVRMEEEMARFRTQLLASEKDRYTAHQSTEALAVEEATATATTTTTRRTRQVTRTTRSSIREAGGERQQVGGNNWLDELNSPLVKQSEGGNRMLELRFDLTDYEPEQIVVKTIDNRLQVHARSEQSGANSSVYREYNREFLLPTGTNPELIKSSLSSDGVLTVQAPLTSNLLATQD